MTNTETDTEMQFEIVPESLGLPAEAKHSLEIAFGDYFTQAQKWKDQAQAITEPKLARAARLELKNIRVAAEKTRKELKEDSLRTGKAIDGANNILLALIVPIEKHLEDVEKAAERAEQARIEALERDRLEQLVALECNPLPNNLGLMSEEHWELSLQNAKDALAARKERERLAEEERVAKEKAEAEEKARIAAENARLKAEAEKREAEIRAEREAAAKKQAEIEAAAKAERDKAEAARKKAEEHARQEREAIEAKAKADREAAEEAARIEKAKAEKAEAEARKLREAEAKRIADLKAAEAKAAKAPEKEKIQAFADQVRTLKIGSMKTPEGNAVATEIQKKVESFAKWIESQAATL